MRKAIPVRKRIGITLWYLATNMDFRSLGHLIGVSKSTVCITVKEVCAEIVNILLPIKYIKIPSGEVLKQVIRGFKHKLGFLQCAGAVDGTHIRIVAPRECPVDCYCRKGWYSIILQGVVNYQGHFTEVYVGWPWRVHDARVFVNSPINMPKPNKIHCS